MVVFVFFLISFDGVIVMMLNLEFRVRLVRSCLGEILGDCLRSL